MFGKRVPKSRRAPIIREYDRYLSPHFWRTSLMSKLGMINLHSLGGVHGTSFNRPFQSLGLILKLLNYLSMIRRMRQGKKGNRCCAATARGRELKGLAAAISHSPS